ncbi:MAG TPA: hypothetical protein VKD90_29970, partial [Gemmataceae bacterium]|nr:hypothetical protein [Gemmataceae bacterium]
ATPQAPPGYPEFHELANVYPMFPDDRLAELVEDIKANGLEHEIVKFQNKILDGRNRAWACHKAGVEPRYKNLPAGKDPVALMISLNERRRDLTTAQRRTLVRMRVETVARLRRSGLGIEDIAGKVGKGVGQVHRDLEAARKAKIRTEPRKKRLRGQDGKARPSTYRPRKATPTEKQVSNGQQDRTFPDGKVEGSRGEVGEQQRLDEVPTDVRAV